MPIDPRSIETGPKVEAVHKHHSQNMPAQVPGQHLWIITSMFRVTPHGNQAKYHLDTENLLTIEGPGCYWCGELWSPTVAAKPCKGEF